VAIVQPRYPRFLSSSAVSTTLSRSQVPSRPAELLLQLRSRSHLTHFSSRWVSNRQDSSTSVEVIQIDQQSKTKPSGPANMPDTPTLTRSSAARDSLPTTPIYGAHGKTLNPLTGPSRPGHYRGFSDSSMSQDPSNLPSDYFGAALSRPDLPRRGHSSDLRSGMASPMMPEVPSE